MNSTHTKDLKDMKGPKTLLAFKKSLNLTKLKILSNVLGHFCQYFHLINLIMLISLCACKKEFRLL